MREKENYAKKGIIDLVKGLSLCEKIVLKIHGSLFIKVYKLGITFGFNNK